MSSAKMRPKASSRNSVSEATAWTLMAVAMVVVASSAVMYENRRRM